MLCSWSAWSSCAAEQCGNGSVGQQTRVAYYVSPDGNSTSADVVCDREAAPCDCPACVYSAWSAWSACPRDACPGTTQLSTRTLLVPSYCAACECGELERHANCPPRAPSDCVVSSWSAWSTCSLCNDEHVGLRVRSRAIDVPALCQELSRRRLVVCLFSIPARLNRRRK